MNLKEIVKRGLRYVLKGVPDVTVVADIHYTSPSACLYKKNIIITGGGRGLGYAMAKKFVAEGANVLISGKNESVLRDSAKEIGCQYLTRVSS